MPLHIRIIVCRGRSTLEYEDRLVFMNEGSFIPGSIDALAVGYKPPYYRNSLLAKAMSKVGMIDQNAIGIRNVFEMAGSAGCRCLYDLSNRLAYRSRSMEPSSMRNIRNYLRPSRIWICRSVAWLDMIQKGLRIERQSCFAEVTRLGRGALSPGV